MKKLFIVCIALLSFNGCGASCKFITPFNTGAALDRSLPVLIATPEDGWYGGRQYMHTGLATAREIRRVISIYATEPVRVTDCKDVQCLDNKIKSEYSYYFVPEILSWENRISGFTMRPDRLELRLTAYDLKTGHKIDSFTSKGKSSLFFTSRSTPFKLIKHPVNLFIRALYGIDQTKQN